MAQEQMNTALRDLAPGERFCGVYLLKSAQTGVTSTGKPYLSFRLADLTGELPGKAWDYAGPLGGGDAGQSVWVRGRVELYQNAPQAALEEIRLTDERDEVDPARFVPAAPHDPEKMLAYVRKTLEGLEDADYRTVCLAVLDRRQDAFAALPGGKTMHHSFRHGLLMHTANMMRQADQAAVAADPEIAVGRLHDGVGLSGGQARFLVEDVRDVVGVRALPPRRERRGGQQQNKREKQDQCRAFFHRDTPCASVVGDGSPASLCRYRKLLYCP